MEKSTPFLKKGHPYALPIRRVVSPLVGLILCVIAAPPAVHAQMNLMTNGDFERGDLSGWTVVNESSGTDPQRNFYAIAPGGNTPADGGSFFFSTASNPSGGTTLAVSTSTIAGRSSLAQSFVAPTLQANQVLTYSFQIFSNSPSGYGIDTGTGGGVVVGNNFNYTGGFEQYSRADLVTAADYTANAFTNNTVAQLYAANINSTVDANSNFAPGNYTTVSGTLTGLTAGETYFLRFAEVDTNGAVNLGVDNVSIEVSTLPEASPALLIAVGLPLLGICIHRYRRQS